MPIHFETSRWDDLEDTYQQWWHGELKRPIIQLRISGAHDPGRDKPALPNKSFTSHYAYDISPEAIVDTWDYALSTQTFLGDAFPTAWPNFGPGVLAAFAGCDLQNNEHTTWFQPHQEAEARDIRIAFNPDNTHFKRVRSLCEAAMRRWRGQVQVAMTDLGGSLDIVSSFRPSERLLMDLYDDPESVKRLTRETHDAWFQCFDALNTVLTPQNPGYTAWAPIFSREPYYMLQCDFCYMIGPDMFDEFVKPELAESCKRLKHPFYHLDGAGQLAHLDSLLTIDALAGVQWVPGDGAPPCREWPEVYRTIRDAGKRIQVLGGMEDFDAVVEQLGSAEGLFYALHLPATRRAEGEAFLARYGV